MLSGPLTQSNVAEVAEHIRNVLGQKFCIASAECADSGNAQVRCIPDAVINSSWTREAVKEHGVSQNEPVLVIRRDDGRCAIMFSAGGYLWHFTERTYVVLERNSIRFEQMAAAGPGYLHKHLFVRQMTED